MKSKIRTDGISWRAEFIDGKMEDDYYGAVIFSSQRYIRFVILAAGLVFFSLNILDYSQHGISPVFWRSAGARTCILVLSVVAAVILSKTRNTTLACSCITFFPMLLSLAYLYTAVQHQSDSFTLQAMIIMVMLFFTTLMPNRWMNLVSIDSFIVLALLVVSPRFIPGLTRKEYLGAAACVLLTLLFAVVTQYRLNINQREKHLREKQLQAMSETDKLTSVYNRLWFDRTFAEWCSPQGGKEEFALVLLDIDDFKQVNDTYGHLEGDKVLVECSRIVQKSVRQSDLMARWGGEEFMLLLPDVDMERAVILAERMRSNVEQHNFGKVKRVTCSFGVAVHRPGNSVEDMIHEVDEQLYHAKHSGKNQVAYRQQ